MTFLIQFPSLSSTHSNINTVLSSEYRPGCQLWLIQQLTQQTVYTQHFFCSIIGVLLKSTPASNKPIILLFNINTLVLLCA